MPNDRTDYPGVGLVRDDPDPAPLVSDGDIIAGKFRVERLIDEGGMGLVVEATHLGLDERVALKFLRREILGRPEFVARFAREARAAVKLKSEHVARVSDVGVDDVRGPFMVMEYLEGMDLRDLVRRSGAVPISESVEYIIQACEAVAEAHARGIVHRDIKPENLFLVERTDTWRVIKVLDFGISKLRGALTELEVVNTASLMGSPCYMSPEQLRSTKDADHRADIWSLGAVLFELVTGVPPFDVSRTLPEIVANVLDGPIPRLTEFEPAAPEALADAVARCMTRDPAERFQCAAELAVALLPFAPRRARVPVERAIAVSRMGGLLSDPTLKLPPSVAPGPTSGAVASAPAPGQLSQPPVPRTSPVVPPPAPDEAPPSSVQRIAPLQRTQSTGPTLALAKTMPAPGTSTVNRRLVFVGAGAVLVLLGAVFWIVRGASADSTAPSAAPLASSPPVQTQTATAEPSTEPTATADLPGSATGAATRPPRAAPGPWRGPPPKGTATSKPSAAPAAQTGSSPDLDIKRTR